MIGKRDLDAVALKEAVAEIEKLSSSRSSGE